MNPIYNNYVSIMNEVNQDLKDFEVLGQIKPGNKIGVDRNHHFYISSGSTQGFIGSKIQGSQRWITGQSLGANLLELTTKIDRVSNNLSKLSSKIVLENCTKEQIIDLKKSLAIDINVLNKALEGLKNLSTTYKSLSDSKVDVKKISQNRKDIEKLIETADFLIKDLDENTIHIAQGEQIIEELSKRIAEEDIFQNKGSEAATTNLIKKIVQSRENLNLSKIDSAVLVSVLKKIIKDTNILENELERKYLDSVNLSDGDKIANLKSIFGNIKHFSRKRFAYNICKLCENIYNSSKDKPQTLKLLNMFGFESSIVQKKGDRERAENVFKFLIANYKNIIVHSWHGLDFLDSSHSLTASTSSESDKTGIIVVNPPEIDIEKHLKEIL